MVLNLLFAVTANTEEEIDTSNFDPERSACNTGDGLGDNRTVPLVPFLSLILVAFFQMRVYTLFLEIKPANKRLH